MQANEAIQEKILWIFDGVGSRRKLDVVTPRFTRAYGPAMGSALRKVVRGLLFFMLVCYNRVY